MAIFGKRALPRARFTPLGERVPVGDYLVSVIAVTPFIASGGARPEEGSELVSIEIELVSAAPKEALNYRTNQWRVYDEKGYVFAALSSGESLSRKPSLPEGYLTPGTHVRGWVTFVVPNGTWPARVQFFTGYLSAQAADFAVPPEPG